MRCQQQIRLKSFDTLATNLQINRKTDYFMTTTTTKTDFNYDRMNYSAKVNSKRTKLIFFPNVH